MPLSKICSASLLPHHPGAIYPMLSLASCCFFSASSTQAETQTSMGPCGGPKLHWLPRVLDPSLELVNNPLAALALQRASPSPPLRVYEKSAAEKRIDIEWVNWRAGKHQRPLKSIGTEDSEAGEDVKGQDTKMDRSWEGTENLGNKNIKGTLWRVGSQPMTWRQHIVMLFVTQEMTMFWAGHGKQSMMLPAAGYLLNVVDKPTQVGDHSALSPLTRS